MQASDLVNLIKSDGVESVTIFGKPGNWYLYIAGQHKGNNYLEISGEDRRFTSLDEAYSMAHELGWRKRIEIQTGEVQ